MLNRSHLQNGLIASVAVLFAGAPLIKGSQQNGPVLSAAASFVKGATPAPARTAVNGIAAQVGAALGAFTSVVRPLSTPTALENGFRSYFAYKSAHPSDVKKPYLYFVDYGQPSTQPRGYVFDMNALRIVDGPFMVAQGRGSLNNRDGVPTRFSNARGSEATSLGLYLTQSVYPFTGKTAGRSYHSIGLRLVGVSTGFNDNALSRGVVTHGAPYVTATKAGRSEGCPAMEPARAQQLLPKLADGALVFLFAPNQSWLAGDPWVVATE